MSTTYDINEFGEVVPTTDGHRCNDTRAWRCATEFELEQRDEIARLQAVVEELKEELKEVYK